MADIWLAFYFYVIVIVLHYAFYFDMEIYFTLNDEYDFFSRL